MVYVYYMQYAQLTNHKVIAYSGNVKYQIVILNRVNCWCDWYNLIRNGYNGKNVMKKELSWLIP